MTDSWYASTSPDAIALEPNLIAASADGGRIAENILQFSRLLRSAGLPVGPDRVILANRAVLAAGIESAGVLYWTLHASLVSRPEQHDIFDQAFYLFWKDPDFLRQMLSVMAPQIRDDKASKASELSRRLREPLFPGPPKIDQQPAERLELDMSGSFSADERLRAKDFEQMSAEEQARARAAIARMSLLMAEIPTRRFANSLTPDRMDLRRMLRETGGKGTDHLQLRYKARKWRTPPLVVLCDISGSMDSYARMMLHFLYAVTNARDRVHAFLFGTRLTNVTRALHGRDPRPRDRQGRARCRGLERRHPHRRQSGGVQQAVGASRARPERAGSAHHRWPRPAQNRRWWRRPRRRRAKAAGVVPPTGMDEPALAL